MSVERGSNARAARRGLARRTARGVARDAGALHFSCRRISCPVPRWARSSQPLLSTLFRAGPRPFARTRISCRPKAARAPARPLRAELDRRGEPGPGSRVASTARSRSSTGAARSAGSRRYRGNATSTRTRRRPPSSTVPGARPQRDLRLGPARRRDPPADVARRVAAHGHEHARLRAAVRRHPRDHRGMRAPGAEVEARGRRTARAAARPHVPRD